MIIINIFPKYFFIEVDLLNWFLIPSFRVQTNLYGGKQPLDLNREDYGYGTALARNTVYRYLFQWHSLRFLCFTFKLGCYRKTGWAKRFPKGYVSPREKRQYEMI